MYQFDGGAFIRWRFASNWDLQPELDYDGKGTKFVDNTGINWTLNLHYLEVPVLLRGSARAGTSTRLFVEAGPALAHRTSCTLSGTSPSQSSTIDCAKDKAFNASDFSALFGAGIELPTGSHAASLETRFAQGLHDITTGQGAKNRDLQVLAAFRF